ncbi:related to hydroxymethylglutaryl-CoA lyase [Ramularia collo-cygni]|uniref:hydroxymethylglutaryl-CoA lyase n=1 Tax=Ramularia collo-cygni TaxID=112498 RepID=A0A2D3VHE8_9PEZI|nr:related to hydroxymethylglutaryl-CoA lyase [Ramularia collo-cygni]CZT24742.1 related to hydroxymethylglutaryl-CoA lyase [Ramularia collo-cygni]
MSLPTTRALCRTQPIRRNAAITTRTFTQSSRALADQVRIVEVGPRDGLQNEKTSISADTKIELVRRLAKSGLKIIEAGSFVHPKWVPQMAASDKVLSSILQQPPPSKSPITYQWLLPNSKGFENFFKVMNTSASAPNGYPTPPPSPTYEQSPALNTSSQDPNAMPSTSGVESMLNGSGASEGGASEGGDKHEISIFLAATESFSKKNTNCTIQESLDRFAPLMAQSREAGYAVRAYISVALGCPFEGPDVDPHRVAELAASLLEMGADEISVADTTGTGTAPRTRKLLQTLKEAGIQNSDLAFHFHDTYGQALVNTMVSLDHGIRTFDSAVGGLGGCPYSPGATGNVSTEDLVHCLHSLGADTGVDLEEVSRIGGWITKEIGKPNSSSAGKATLARLEREGSL